VRAALSEISTVNATFAEDVAAYADAGFDAIGLWESKLPADDDANRALLARHGLAAANCIPLVPSVLQLGRPGMEGPADPAVRVEALCASVRRLAAYGPESILVLAGPLGGRTREEGWALLADGLREAVATATQCGTRIALEIVHPSLHDATGFLHTLDETDALLAEPGLDRLGLLFDTYHLAELPGVHDWIRTNIGRIHGVHVSDWPARDRSDRVLPGQGITPTAACVETLRAAGWAGSIDVEIFSTPERFWGLPVGEAARQARAALRALGV
jgi:sugar phosphate isomerase/epimerase